jgi:hypothetical protein
MKNTASVLRAVGLVSFGFAALSFIGLSDGLELKPVLVGLSLFAAVALFIVASRV